MVEVIHLDSCLLRGLLDHEDQQDTRSKARRLVNSMTGSVFRVSILAVGEVLGKMAEERGAAASGDAASELSRLFRGGRLQLYGIGKGSEVSSLVTALMAADGLLSPADAFLVACALADEEATVFATLDQDIIHSRIVKSHAAQRALRILDADRARWKDGIAKIGGTAHKNLGVVTDPRAAAMNPIESLGSGLGQIMDSTMGK